MFSFCRQVANRGRDFLVRFSWRAPIPSRLPPRLEALSGRILLSAGPLYGLSLHSEPSYAAGAAPTGDADLNAARPGHDSPEAASAQAREMPSDVSMSADAADGRPAEYESAFSASEDPLAALGRVSSSRRMAPTTDPSWTTAVTTSATSRRRRRRWAWGRPPTGGPSLTPALPVAGSAGPARNGFGRNHERRCRREDGGQVGRRGRDCRRPGRRGGGRGGRGRWRWRKPGGRRPGSRDNRLDLAGRPTGIAPTAQGEPGRRADLRCRCRGRPAAAGRPRGGFARPEPDGRGGWPGRTAVQRPPGRNGKGAGSCGRHGGGRPPVPGNDVPGRGRLSHRRRRVFGNVSQPPRFPMRKAVRRSISTRRRGDGGGCGGSLPHVGLMAPVPARRPRDGMIGGASFPLLFVPSLRIDGADYARQQTVRRAGLVRAGSFAPDGSG